MFRAVRHSLGTRPWEWVCRAPLQHREHTDSSGNPMLPLTSARKGYWVAPESRLLLVRSRVHRPASQQRNQQDRQRRMHIVRSRNETHKPIGDRRKDVGADSADHRFEVEKRIYHPPV